MQINIEPNNGIPIYEQLVRQVKYAVAEEVVVPGQVVPSVREMARTLAVNPNTVQRAYLQLQEEHILQTLRGRGMAVAHDAKQRCVSDRRHLLAERLKAVIEEAIQSGLSRDRLTSMFQECLEASLRKSSKTSENKNAEPNAVSDPSNQETNS